MDSFSFFPPAASANASEVDALYGFLLVVGIGMTVLIFFFVFFFAIKYRRQSDFDKPKAIHGSLPLEISWSVLPFIIMLGMFAWGTKLYFQNYTPPPGDTLDIYVTGKQWMWKVQYPGGQREIDELHVPTGRAVKLTLASEDVIHSFYLPAFRLKHDVVPGSYQTFWFEPTKPGRYHIFCAEYCGTNHSRMIGWVTVMDPNTYQQWLAGGQTGETMAQMGEKVFEKYGCLSCHAMEGGKYPSLKNVYGHPIQLENGNTINADEAYLREAILNPNKRVVKGYPANIMPVFQGQISEEQLLQLIVYIKSLSSTDTSPANKPAVH